MIEVAVRKNLRAFTLDLRATFARGVTVVSGPSGAGKSTLLRLIAGLDAPDAGTISIDGAPLFDASRNVPAFRRDIGYVVQDYALFAHLDVLANVGYGLRAGGTPRAQRDAIARSWLERLGLAELAHVRPPALSGGERQRVALARAVARQPRALLLDEPFAALDSATRERVRAQVAELCAELDLPVVLVTHDPGDAATFDAPVLRIEGGVFVTP
jgi:molybdate transport system ATP-binding protein